MDEDPMACITLPMVFETHGRAKRYHYDVTNVARKSLKTELRT